MKIFHLFHDLMNLYGEYANTLALQRALSEKGRAAEIIKLSIGDELDFSDADFIYIGSGTEKNQKVMLKYLRGYSEKLKEFLDGGKTILATGNSFEVFGKSITDKNGKVSEGLGFFDFTVSESAVRTVEDVTADFSGEKVFGFINKCSEIYDVPSEFFLIKQGVGNNKGSPAEGIRAGGFYGTHIIGPLLIRNKNIAKHFADILTQKSE